MKRIALVFALVLVTSTASAQRRRYQPPPEMRWHHRITNQTGETVFETTIIRRDSESEARTTHLIRTKEGHRLVVTDLTSFHERKSVWEIRDPESKSFVATSLDLQTKGRTRSEYFEERKKSDSHDVESPITVTAGGLSFTGSEAEWKKPENLRAWRYQLRQAAGPQMVEAIELLRDGLFSTQLRDIATFLLPFVTYGDCPMTEKEYELVEAAPDCDFDAEFRFPCSDEQKAQLAAARKKLETPTRY